MFKTKRQLKDEIETLKAKVWWVKRHRDHLASDRLFYKDQMEKAREERADHKKRANEAEAECKLLRAECQRAHLAEKRAVERADAFQREYDAVSMKRREMTYRAEQAEAEVARLHARLAEIEDAH